MVSRNGASSPEECFGQFITDSDNTQNFLSWDVIPHSNSAGTFFDTGIHTMQDYCQDNCAQFIQCEYMEWHEDTRQCFQRMAPNALTDIANRISGSTAAWWDAPGVNMVLFEVRGTAGWAPLGGLCFVTSGRPLGLIERACTAPPSSSTASPNHPPPKTPALTHGAPRPPPSTRPRFARAPMSCIPRMAGSKLA